MNFIQCPSMVGGPMALESNACGPVKFNPNVCCVISSSGNGIKFFIRKCCNIFFAGTVLTRLGKQLFIEAFCSPASAQGRFATETHWTKITWQYVFLGMNIEVNHVGCVQHNTDFSQTQFQKSNVLNPKMLWFCKCTQIVWTCWSDKPFFILNFVVYELRYFGNPAKCTHIGALCCQAFLENLWKPKSFPTLNVSFPTLNILINQTETT